MAIKVYLEKAYDQNRWSFLKDTLLDIGLPDNFVSAIMRCVSSCSMQVAWNASLDQADVIKGVLEEFCESGQKVNANKTHVFFSKNVSSNLKMQMSRALGFKATDNLGKYLGVSLLHGRINLASYSYILDNAKKRLSEWNAAHLSMAGRITLATSVIASMPLYAMQTTKLAKSICNNIEKSYRKFIWGCSAENRKVMLIPWNEVRQPKAEGGLGFRNLQYLNDAFLMKLGWGIMNDGDAHWAQVPPLNISSWRTVILMRTSVIGPL
ncbi:uncharacterized protein LOC105648985 [Jatropha curcas]|uniref:uncharacterized protein LOC105648985 n=1 Tax=Jatropha curcas TaxID=180498 RepID=UPI0005FB12FC|nr:uncharacterized protein LOC105648985 [Jatropha curcas]